MQRRLLIAGLALALMLTSAQAQLGQVPGANVGANASKAEQQGQKAVKPKADEKAYNSALGNIPDKRYDPWRGVR
jgi:long-subunit fatty acid transport protein